MSLLAGLLLFGAVGLLLAWSLCAIQCFTAFGLTVKVDSMVKNIGDTVTVTVTPIPAEAVVSNVVYTADPAFFAPTLDANVFTAVAVGSSTIKASALAADGSVVEGESEAIEIQATPPVIATGLLVAVA